MADHGSLMPIKLPFLEFISPYVVLITSFSLSLSKTCGDVRWMETGPQMFLSSSSVGLQILPITFLISTYNTEEKKYTQNILDLS